MYFRLLYFIRMPQFCRSMLKLKYPNHYVHQADAQQKVNAMTFQFYVLPPLPLRHPQVLLEARRDLLPYTVQVREVAELLLPKLGVRYLGQELDLALASHHGGRGAPLPAGVDQDRVHLAALVRFLRPRVHAPQPVGRLGLEGEVASEGDLERIGEGLAGLELPPAIPPFIFLSTNAAGFLESPSA